MDDVKPVIAGLPVKPGSPCPYCKIAYSEETAWAFAERPKVVCVNCRNYARRLADRKLGVPHGERS